MWVVWTLASSLPLLSCHDRYMTWLTGINQHSSISTLLILTRSVSLQVYWQGEGYCVITAINNQPSNLKLTCLHPAHFWVVVQVCACVCVCVCVCVCACVYVCVCVSMSMCMHFYLKLSHNTRRVIKLLAIYYLLYMGVYNMILRVTLNWRLRRVVTVSAGLWHAPITGVIKAPCRLWPPPARPQLHWKCHHYLARVPLTVSWRIYAQFLSVRIPLIWIRCHFSVCRHSM